MLSEFQKSSLKWSETLERVQNQAEKMGESLEMSQLSGSGINMTRRRAGE